MIHEVHGNDLTPQKKRRQSTEQRLRAALERLLALTPNHPSLRGRSYRLSVATLAREARVGRNTIYTNHRSVIDELDCAAQQNSAPGRPARDETAAKLHLLIEQSQQRHRQLATANAELLNRAIDAEKMVERLKKQNAKLVRALTTAHQPIALSSRRA